MQTRYRTGGAVLALLLLTGLFVCPITLQAALLFTADYESGSLSQWPQQIECCDYSQSIVTSPTRAGRYAARFELHQTDRQVGNGKRSEVVFASGKLGVIGGPDEWYGFSLYLPPGYVIDTYPMNYLGMGAFEMLAQWHSHPDTDEVPPFPPLALMTDKGHWKVINRYSGAAMLQSPVDGVTKLYDLGPYAPGAWTDFVVHIRWSCRDAPPLAERCQSMPQGVLQIWKDGKQLVNYTGPTAYNDKARVFLKTGVYKGMWKVHTTHVRERVVYQDEFRIGDATSSYAEVAPPGRPGPQPPGDSTPPGAPLRLRAAIPAPQ